MTYYAITEGGTSEPIRNERRARRLARALSRQSESEYRVVTSDGAVLVVYRKGTAVRGLRLPAFRRLIDAIDAIDRKRERELQR